MWLTNFQNQKNKKKKLINKETNEQTKMQSGKQIHRQKGKKEKILQYDTKK